MIIYKNGLIILDYSPSTDVLHVELPNAVAFGVSELQHSLRIVAENVQSYDIKKLLLDSSQVSVAEIDDESYKTVVSNFVGDLARTRLRKLARLNTTTLSLDERVTQVSSAAAQLHNTSFQISVFNNKTRALDWLLLQ